MIDLEIIPDHFAQIFFEETYKLEKEQRAFSYLWSSQDKTPEDEISVPKGCYGWKNNK